MSFKKVLILESGAALAEIVDHFLAQSEKFHVLRVTPNTADELSEVLSVFKPDLILMDDVVFHHNYTKLLVFLKDLSRCEIVVLHSQTNLLNRFSAEPITLKRASDLVSTLAGGG